MSQLLTEAELDAMRAEHVPFVYRKRTYCLGCTNPENGRHSPRVFPCDAARILAELDRREALHSWQGRDHHSPVPHLKTFVDVRERITGLREHDGVSCCEWATDGPCPWSSQGVQGALFGPSDSTDFTPREA